MGLSDDQRAMLRMVAQRGEQGYEDIAALMGLSVDEVRAKVTAALAELDEEGALAGAEKSPAAESPVAKAEKVESPPAPAKEPEARLTAAVPPPPPPPAPPRKPPGGGRPGLPSGTVLRAAIAGAAIVVALVVIALIVGGGGESDTSTSGDTTATAETSTGKGSGNANEVTKAILKPVDGGKAEGVVVFGKVKKSLALEIAAEGLQPTGSGEEYTVWLSQSPQKMLPLASVKAPKGRIAAQITVPAEVLAYLADETFTEIAVTLTDTASLNAALKAAVKEKSSTTEYTGSEALRGTVTGPIVGAAQRLEEREAEEKGE